MSEALDLERLRALCEAATEGPWRPGRDRGASAVWAGGMRVVLTGHAVFDDANAEFIAAARTALPALLDRVAALEGECERVTVEYGEGHPAVFNALQADREEALDTIRRLGHAPTDFPCFACRFLSRVQGESTQ